MTAIERVAKGGSRLVERKVERNYFIGLDRSVSANAGEKQFETAAVILKDLSTNRQCN